MPWAPYNKHYVREMRSLGGIWDPKRSVWLVRQSRYERALEYYRRYIGKPPVTPEPRQAETPSIENEHGLPELVGTPKQVAWARDIRAKIIQAVYDWVDQLCSEHPEQEQAIREQVPTWIQALTKQTRAAWWIDHRNDTDDPRWVIKCALNA
jgi:hypothetical protein